jgi:RNA polymerase sigma factor (sigma-70 family)
MDLAAEAMPARAPWEEGGELDVGSVVLCAAEGDQRAWERLVELYGRLVWAMTREFRLDESDAADVVQTTWMRLLEHIDRLDHPERVGSWLAATARNECLRGLASRKRVVLVQDDVTLMTDLVSGPEVDERLLVDERAQDVRQALSHLPGRWQRLLQLLMSDPPVSYAEISDQLGIPIGSIGPTRGRCLETLRGLLQAS